MKSPATLTTGTAKENAEHDEGFSANGESQFSRRAAHPDNVRLQGYKRPRPKMALAADIGFNVIEIERMQRALTVERDPKRIAKLRKNIEIKTKFVERLKSEIDAET